MAMKCFLLLLKYVQYTYALRVVRWTFLKYFPRYIINIVALRSARLNTVQ